MCRRSGWAIRSSRQSSPRTPTSGSSARLARSTTAMPTVTATASGPARCCCARGSFYELDADGIRQRAHFDGLPVGFIAEAISTLGAQSVASFQTYHVMNPYDDGIGFDEFVDWLIAAAPSIQ